MAQQNVSDKNSFLIFIGYATKYLSEALFIYLTIVPPFLTAIFWMGEVFKNGDFITLGVMYFPLLTLFIAFQNAEAISGNENGELETAHTKIQTDAADNSTDTTTVITTNIAKSVTVAALTIPTATLLAVPSSNVHASKCTHQNNVYASLSADEDVHEVVGSDNNL